VHATDASNAARTLLFDIGKGEWDGDLCKQFGVPERLLPTVCDNAGEFGVTAPDLFGAPIRILGMAGDQQAATIGQGCFKPGMMKSTYGTGCFMVLNTGAERVASRNRLLTTIAYQLEGKRTYALEGAIFIAGAAVQWLRDGLKVIAHSAEADALAGLADPAEQVYLVPAFVGLGAPYWDAKARGAIFGLTRSSGDAVEHAAAEHRRAEVTASQIPERIVEIADRHHVVAGARMAVRAVHLIPEPLDRERIHHSLRRRLKWAQWASPPNEYRRASAADVAWGSTLADRVVHVARGAPPRVTSPVEIVVVDDDLGGPYPAPSRDPFLQALSIGGVEVKRVEKVSGDGRASVVIALFGDIRSWKGRPGYSAEARKAVDKVIDKAPEAIVVQFSHPRLAAELKKPKHVVSAWGGETVMQQAAARWLLKAR